MSKDNYTQFISELDIFGKPEKPSLNIRASIKQGDFRKYQFRRNFKQINKRRIECFLNI